MAEPCYQDQMYIALNCGVSTLTIAVRLALGVAPLSEQDWGLNYGG